MSPPHDQLSHSWADTSGKGSGTSAEEPQEEVTVTSDGEEEDVRFEEDEEDGRSVTSDGEDEEDEISIENLYGMDVALRTYTCELTK